MTRILTESKTRSCNSSMMHNSHPEKECDYSFHVINNLPEFIKETILEYLPIKEAVRTCILSKDWRHTWSKVHNLYIDVGNEGSNSGKIMAPGSEEELKSNEEALKSTRFIDKVLNLHNGNVHTLKISGAKFAEEDFERLMLKLSQMQIRKLVLDLECKRRWSFRPRTCQITSICAIRLPKDFNGLKLLRSLHLSGHCKINETDITKLISSCPLLEELKLNNFSYRVLKIHAMNLRKMTLVGNFGDLYLQTPKLLEVFIFLYYRITVATLKMVVGRNLLQTLSSISHLRYLSICCQCSVRRH